MQSRLFSLRGAIYTLILFLSAVLAHFLAFGTFISPSRFCLEGLFIGTLLYFGLNRELEGPRLALLALVTQAAVHVILGGMVMNSSRMLAWHAVFALLSYWAIRLSEKFWHKGLLFVLPINSARRLLVSLISTNSQPAVLYCKKFLTLWIDRSAHSLRAPPLLAV